MSTRREGAGSVSWRVLGIGSIDAGRVGFHGNAGIVRGGVSDELMFSGALLGAVTPRFTVSGELLGRYVSELRDIALSPEPHPTYIGVDTLRLLPGNSGTTLVTALAGFNWNVTGTLVLGGHVAFPLAERGLRATITPTVALEYAFPR